MAYPSLTELATFVIVPAAGIPLVYIFTKLLKLHPQIMAFSEEKREARTSFLVFVTVLLATFGIYGFYDRVWVRATLTADPLYVLRDTIWIILIVMPVIIALRLTGQTFQSIGASQKDIQKNLAFGLLLSSVLLFVFGFLSPFLGGGFVSFSLPVVYLLVSCLVIGFGEEVVFRGYIQTRLTAHWGPPRGITVASILFVVYNFPLGYFCFSGDIPLSVLFALWRFSTGMLYGYTFHRSQNLLPSSILHTMLVWGGLLFGLYL